MNNLLKNSLILVIAIFVLGFIYAQINFSDESIYGTSLKPAKDLVSIDDGKLTQLEQLINHYNSGRYKIAEFGFKEYLDSNSKNDTALFYLGVCETLNEKYALANTHLDKVQGSFRCEAQWYRALNFFKLNNEVESKAILNEVKSCKNKSLLERVRFLEQKIDSPLRNLVI